MRFINELCKITHRLFLFDKNMSPVMKLVIIILIILNSNFFVFSFPSLRIISTDMNEFITNKKH